MCLPLGFTTLQIHCFEGVIFSSSQLSNKKSYIVCIKLYTPFQAFTFLQWCIMHCALWCTGGGAFFRINC